MEPGNHKVLIYRPALVWTGIAVLLVVLATAGYLLFRTGMGYAGGGERVGREEAILQRQLKEARQENTGLRQQLAILERSSEIDRLATLEVRDDFARLQGEMQKLRKELAFYRGIVSPADGTAGLSIQRFELKHGALPGRYTFQVVLTQVKGNDRFVQGVVEIVIEGLQDGQHKAVSLDSLRVDGGKAMKFKFRYFQRLEGEIAVPDGFEPRQLTVRARTSGKRRLPEVEKTLEWPG